MTNYGTIPTSTPAGGAPTGTSNFISRAKVRVTSGLGSRKPWKEMFDFNSLNFPSSFSEAIARHRKNVAYFRVNYTIAVLIILFLTLLWHPVSLTVFVVVVVVAGWVLHYFSRDGELVIRGSSISDRTVFYVLLITMVVALLLTDFTLGVGGWVMVAVLWVHSAVRRTDDLYDEEDGGQRPLYPSSTTSS